MVNVIIIHICTHRDRNVDDLGVRKIWIWTEGYKLYNTARIITSYLCPNYRPSEINYSKKKKNFYLNCSSSENKKSVKQQHS